MTQKMKMFLFCFVLLVGFSTLTFADMKKGNVGGGGTKRYMFVANGTGQTQITLIFDNYGSDIDLAAGIVVDGEPMFLAIDVSSSRNFAQIQFGVQPNLVVYVLVDSYRGGSPFHITINTGEEEIISNGMQEMQSGSSEVHKLEAALQKLQNSK